MTRRTLILISILGVIALLVLLTSCSVSYERGPFNDEVDLNQEYPHAGDEIGEEIHRK